MHQQFVDALADFREFVRKEIGADALVEWCPRAAGVGAAKRSSRGDCDDHASAGKALYGMQTHPARARLPFGAGFMIGQGRYFGPGLTPVLAAEEHTRIAAGVNYAGLIGSARLNPPQTLQ